MLLLLLLGRLIVNIQRAAVQIPPRLALCQRCPRDVTPYRLRHHRLLQFLFQFEIANFLHALLDYSLYFADDVFGFHVEDVQMIDALWRQRLDLVCDRVERAARMG